MKIGVLEDNPAICDYLKVALEMTCNHDVSIHNYGASLLERLLTAYLNQAPLPYDLLIIDLGLPGGMSGQEVIDTIQRTFSHRAPPIIVLSAVGTGELEDVRTKLKVPVLRKPFKMQALLGMIEQAV